MWACGTFRLHLRNIVDELVTIMWAALCIIYLVWQGYHLSLISLSTVQHSTTTTRAASYPEVELCVSHAPCKEFSKWNKRAHALLCTVYFMKKIVWGSSKGQAQFQTWCPMKTVFPLKLIVPYSHSFEHPITTTTLLCCISDSAEHKNPQNSAGTKTTQNQLKHISCVDIQ